MNAPDRESLFIVGEGLEKVTYKVDQKVLHSGEFTVQCEDHTLGNLVRMQLHANKNVLFAGYKCPHPLEPKVVIKVQTNGRETPMEAVKHAVKDLRDALESLRINFEENAEKARLRDHAGW